MRQKNAPKMKLPGEDLLPFLGDAKGICINVALDEHCADLLTEAKKKHPFKVMWEAPASAISELTAIYAGGGPGWSAPAAEGCGPVLHQ